MTFKTKNWVPPIKYRNNDKRGIPGMGPRRLHNSKPSLPSLKSKLSMTIFHFLGLGGSCWVEQAVYAKSEFYVVHDNFSFLGGVRQTFQVLENAETKVCQVQYSKARHLVCESSIWKRFTFVCAFGRTSTINQAWTIGYEYCTRMSGFLLIMPVRS